MIAVPFLDGAPGGCGDELCGFVHGEGLGAGRGVGAPGVLFGVGQGHGDDGRDVLDADEGLGAVRGGHGDLVVVPVEVNVGAGPGGGPHADSVRRQPRRDPRAGLASRPEYKNLVIIRAVHKFMIARQSECFNDLDAQYFA
jgi:hypothetical protein